MELHYVKTTRRYGQCYVRVADRDDTHGTIHGRACYLTCGSWGQSLQHGGNKYKGYARWTDTDRPVPSKLLGEFVTD